MTTCVELQEISFTPAKLSWPTRRVCTVYVMNSACAHRNRCGVCAHAQGEAGHTQTGAPGTYYHTPFKGTFIFCLAISHSEWHKYTILVSIVSKLKNPSSACLLHFIYTDWSGFNKWHQSGFIACTWIHLVSLCYERAEHSLYVLDTESTVEVRSLHTP